MNTSKIIKGVVGGGRYTVTAPIIKEDYGLYLQIEGLELPETYEVDFSNDEHSGSSVTMIGNADGVLIPSQFIKSGKDVFAFLYHVGADFGRTVYKFRIPNKLRPDRTNEEPTPEEQSTIDQTIAALNTAVAKTAQDVIDADASAQSASADADRAEEARTDAQNYATQAKQSATDAHESASQASASATASANSASQSAQIKADVEDLADDAQASASASAQSASASANSASQASGYAQSASASASSAQGYASSAQTSAQTATAKATEASTSASTASQKATESAQSASQALAYKTDAENAKTASQTAQGLAESARDSAISAKEDAEDARDEAQNIVDGISGKVEQIDSNTERIESLEDDRYKPYVTDSASGSIASFPDGADNIPLKSCIVQVESVQEGSGDPSPDNVRPISGFNSVNATRAGKNLLVYPYSALDSMTLNGITFEVHKTAGGRVDYVSASGTATSWCYFDFNTWGERRTNAKMFVGKTFKLTGCPKLGNDDKVGMRFQYRRFGSQQNIGLADDFGDGSNEFTVPSDMEQWAIYIKIAPGTQVNDARFYPMIRLASDTDDTYEPYNGETYPITFPTSAGTIYGGYVDVLTGELVVDRVLWQKNTATMNNDEDYPGWRNAGVREIVGGNASISYSDQKMNIGNKCDINTLGRNDILYLTIRDYGKTQTEWKALALDVQIVLPLATPIHYPLTSYQINSLYGQNNLWANTGDTEVEYRADTKLYIEKLTQLEEDDMIADSAITSGQFFMIGNTLYRALANIASGATITVGTNAQRVSLSDALNLVNA